MSKVTTILHQGNIWQGELVVGSNSTWTSTEYVCGGVMFHVKTRSYKHCSCHKQQIVPADINFNREYIFIVHLNFKKIFRDDNITYMCSIDNGDLVFPFIEHEIEYEILHYTGQLNTTSRNLCVTCDIATEKCNPFVLLSEDTVLTDLKLCGIGGSVSVHASIMACLSPVMKTMLTGEWKEASERKVEIQGTTKTNLEYLKDYIYLDKLPEDESCIEELLVFADRYEMSDLTNKCIVKLLNKLSSENIFEMLEFAGQYKLNKLQYGILKHFPQTISMDKLSKKINVGNAKNDEEKSESEDN